VGGVCRIVSGNLQLGVAPFVRGDEASNRRADRGRAKRWTLSRLGVDHSSECHHLLGTYLTRWPGPTNY
jgi:hypothetical protein